MIKLKPNEIAEVKVQREQTPTERQRGYIFEDNFDNYVPRRLRDNKIYARIWDLGQLVNDDEIEFVYNSPVIFTHNGSYGITDDYQYANDFNSWVFSTSESNWKTIYKEITNLQQYGISFNAISGSTYEIDKGFEIVNQLSPIVSGSRAVQYFNTTNSSVWKITNSSSPSGDEVELIIDKNVEVYLMPLILRWTGRADIWPPPQEFSYPKHDYMLNGFYKALPRSPIINNETLETHYGQPFFSLADMPTISSLPLRHIDVRTIWHNINTQDPNSEMYKVVWHGAFFLRNYTSHTVEDPEDFPRNETANIFIDPSSSPPSYRPYAWCYDNIMPENLLCAVIKKEENWYYIWSKEETSSFSAQGYLIAT